MNGIGPARYVGVRNLVTYLSLLAGLVSVVCAAGGMLHLMAALWAVSAVADVFDGAFARLFGQDVADQHFGVELDSLVDALAFGAFPVVGLYLTGATTSGTVMFVAGAMVYLVATVTRLGHFNMTTLAGATGFRGLPTTEAGLCLATLLLWPAASEYAWIALVVLGLAMLAPVGVPRPGMMGQVFYMLWPAGVLAMHLMQHPWDGR